MSVLDLMLESMCSDLETDIYDSTYIEEGAENVYTEGVFADSRDNKFFINAIQKACQLTYTLCKYAHGVEMDGRIYDIDRSEYQKYYHSLSKQEFFRVKGGLCYDYTNALYPYLVNNGYKPRLFYMEITGTPINHTFIMLPFTLPSKKEKYLYCEPTKKNICGCYSSTDMDSLIASIVGVFRYETIITKPTKVMVYELKPTLSEGLSYADMLKELRKGKVYMSWDIKPFASRGNSTANAKAAKFNPNLLIGNSLDIERIEG